MLQSSRHPVVEEDLRRIVSASLPWDRFSGKTVLISGANGFVPAYMLETLLYLNQSQGARIRVVALVRNRKRAMERLGHLAADPALGWVVQDVREAYAGPSGVDFVVHAASQASPKYYNTDPSGTFEANVVGTLRMLEIAKTNGSEGFLLFSSGDVYGTRPDPALPIHEQSFGYLDPLNIRSCYGEGKRAAETLCACWHAQFGVPVKIARLSHTYGPGMRPDDGRVFADFVADIVAGRDIVMKSDGTARRPFCYIADATIGLFTILLCGNSGEAYNLGSDSECSILELAEMLCSLFPDRGCRVIRKERSPDDPYLPSRHDVGHFDISKMRSLGWEPTTPLREGFRRTIESYRQSLSNLPR